MNYFPRIWSKRYEMRYIVSRGMPAETLLHFLAGTALLTALHTAGWIVLHAYTVARHVACAALLHRSGML